MNQKVSRGLYRNLVFCDFYYSRETLLKQISYKHLCVEGANNIYRIGDLYYLIFSFKQVIKTIQFLSKKAFFKKSVLLLCAENQGLCELMNHLNTSAPRVRNLLIFSDKRLMWSYKFGLSGMAYFCLIGNGRTSNSYLFYDLFNIIFRGVHLILTVFLTSNKHVQGLYELNHELDSVKKVVFIFAMFRKLRHINYGTTKK